MLNDDAKEILVFAIETANAASDGFDWSDLGVLTKAPAAVAGWNNGVESLKAAVESPEGRQEINDFVANRFDIPDDRLEEKIEKSLNWAFATYDLYGTWTAPAEETAVN